MTTASSLNWTAGQDDRQRGDGEGRHRRVGVDHATPSATTQRDHRRRRLLRRRQRHRRRPHAAHPEADHRLPARHPGRPLRHQVGRRAAPATSPSPVAPPACPTDADAVVLNVTATGGTAGSFLTIWPKGESQPTASSINFSGGPDHPQRRHHQGGHRRRHPDLQQRGRPSTSSWTSSGTSSQGVGLAVPAAAQPGADPGLAVRASKVGAYSTPVGPARTATSRSPGRSASIPGNAVAALLNVTVDRHHGRRRSSPCTPRAPRRPTASSLNWAAGQTIPNSVTAKIGTERPDPGLQRGRHRPRAHGRLRVLRPVAADPC